MELPNGEFGLIDFHYDSEHNPNQEPPALTFLKKRHAARKPVVISFLCISHPDFDHVKGLCKVLNWIDANCIDLKQIWLYPGIDEEDAHRALATVKTALKRIRAENLSSGLETPPGAPNNSAILRLEEELECLRQFVKDRSLTPDLIQGIAHLANLANAVEVCSLAPLADDIRKANQQAIRSIYLWKHVQEEQLKLAGRNRLSSIIKMKFGRHQLLFGGDAGESTWQRSLDQFDLKDKHNEVPCDPWLRASFVKASHHGSWKSSSVRLWERVLADTTHVGISAGKGKGHPNAKTLIDIQTASRNRASTAHLLTTNICSRCVINQRLPEENWSWLPATVKPAKRDETADALRLDAPAEGDGANVLRQPPRSEVIRDALRAIAPAKTVEEFPSRGALIAYVMRFHSQSDEVSVAKATADLPKRRDCMFKYEGEKFFPECANS